MASETASSRRARALRFARPGNVTGQRPAGRRAAWLRRSVSLGYLALVLALLVTDTSPERWLVGSGPTSAASQTIWWLLPATLLVALGAGYRPHGGLLGFGALPLPLLASATTGSVASMACFLGTAVAASVLRMLSRHDPQTPRERRGQGRIVLDAAHAGLATLLAAAVWVPLAADLPLAATAASTALWVASAHGLATLQHGSRAGTSPVGSRLHLLWDAVGWCLACSIALLAAGSGLAAVVPILTGFAFLTGVGAARELDRRLHLRRIRDLQSVGSVSQRMVPRDEASELAEQCLEEVRRTLDFAFLELTFESDGGGETFHARAHGPLHEGAAEVPRHPPPAPGIHVRRRWRLLEQGLRSRRSEEGDEGTVRLGRVKVWLDPRQEGEHDEALFADLASQIAALADRSRLDREARLDSLTGLTRRHIFDRELERRLARAQEEGHSVALLLFDLDHFKQINDRHGHDAGDRVLEATASVLQRASQPGGLACRWGGEELALLQWSGGANALSFADELRRFISEQRVATVAGDLVVTASVGVAAFPDLVIREPQELVRLADEALYAAKENGRDQALLARGRGRFESPEGAVVGNLEPLQPGEIPRL